MLVNKDEVSGRRPDYSSRDGVHVWLNQDRNGKDYLAVRIPILGISVNCFQPLTDAPATTAEPVKVVEEEVK